MSLIHPAFGWLLGGILIPVILHLLMRPRPKKLVFPALRLIQLRRKQNLRRLRLRHVGLLLLRMGVIAGIVLAIARPRVASINYLPTTREWGLALCVLLAGALAYWGLTRTRSRAASPGAAGPRPAYGLATGIGLVGLIAISLFSVWPLVARIRAEATDTLPVSNAHVPVAAVMVFDNSLSMDYRQAGVSRLEVAQRIAREHLQSLPALSRVAVTDLSTSGGLVFASDLSGAISRIDRLEVRAVSQPIEDRLAAALEAQREDQRRLLGKSDSTSVGNDDFVREIYLFTDLASSSWRTQAESPLVESFKQTSEIGLYVIDVGIAEGANVGLSQLKVSPEVAAQGGSVSLTATVSTMVSLPEDTNVELLLEALESPRKLVKQSQVPVRPQPNAPAVAHFTLKGVTGRYRQGEIRLSSSDPLQFDDVLHFTIDVAPPIENLVISDDREDAQFWINAVAPLGAGPGGGSGTRCTWVPSRQFPSAKLSGVGVLTLINVNRLSADQWKRIGSFVKDGGQLIVCLGSAVNVGSYTSSAARDVLPCELYGHVRFLPPEYIDLQAGLQHPLFRRFQELGITTFDDIEVRRFWKVSNLPGAQTIVRYTDESKSAALVERRIGQGLSLLLTTSVARSGDWNDFPIHWQFVALADEMIQYLSQRQATPLNFTAGEAVIVRMDESHPRSLLLRKPHREQLPVPEPKGDQALVLSEIDQLGQYHVVSKEPGSSFERGFSVNPPPLENQLTRMSTADLDRKLGSKRWRGARSLQDLQKTVTTKRIGVEITPYLFLFLLVLFVSELLFSNQFYRSEVEPAATSG